MLANTGTDEFIWNGLSGIANFKYIYVIYLNTFLIANFKYIICDIGNYFLKNARIKFPIKLTYGFPSATYLLILLF